VKVVEFLVTPSNQETNKAVLGPEGERDWILGDRYKPSTLEVRDDIRKYEQEYNVPQSVDNENGQRAAGEPKVRKGKPRGNRMKERRPRGEMDGREYLLSTYMTV
jgi:hypothetical protein